MFVVISARYTGTDHPANIVFLSKLQIDRSMGTLKTLITAGKQLILMVAMTICSKIKEREFTLSIKGQHRR
jgi:hypothetical protein